MRFWMLLFLAVATLHGMAQHAKPKAGKNKIHFRSINLFGVLAGEASAEPAVYSVNGLQYKTWFTGIGAGLDYYGQRSIPVFLDVRKNLFSKASSPFIYLAGGRHFAWQQEKPKEWISSGWEGKWYYEAGAGYQMPLTSRIQVIWSAGYSSKKMKEEINTMPWLSVWPAPRGAMQSREYIFRRLSFKMGLQL